MQDTGYNGWTNYPTWCVNLWLSNDEGLYREALERTSETVANPPRVSEYWNDEQTARYNVADTLKDWVCDGLVPDEYDGASFVSDLLGYALDQVNWDEIADAWIEQVQEQAV
jgi:hypothetical protein